MSYHVNPQGEPGLCSAEISCPFGSLESDHFETPTQARQAFELAQREVFPTLKKPARFYHFTPAENLEKIIHEGLKPAIGERSKEFEEKEAKVFLFDSRESAMDGLGGWLGEEFEETDLKLLSVDSSLVVSPRPSFEDDEVSWEWSTSEPIPAEGILLEPGDF